MGLDFCHIRGKSGKSLCQQKQTPDCFLRLLQSVDMLKNIVAFHQLATSAVERTAGGGADGQKITFNVIKQRLGDLLYKVTSQKFEDPEEGEETLRQACRSASSSKNYKQETEARHRCTCPRFSRSILSSQWHCACAQALVWLAENGW